MAKNEKTDFYPGDVPTASGIYIFRDGFGRIIYVGKAKNLRKRVSQYFTRSRLRMADPRLASLVNSIATWEFRAVKNENEALVLESRLIKEYTPYYNILMRDDKRFLMIRINPDEELPRIDLVRIRRNDGALHFGPFPKGGALRETVEFLNRYFGLRSCRPQIPGEKEHRHCLRKTIEHCCAPCVGKTSHEEYCERIGRLLEVMKGKTCDILCEIRIKMEEAAKDRSYEKAAKLRDVAANIDEIFSVHGRNFRFASISPLKGTASVEDLREALGLEKPPTVIEAFDISNISGQLAVGSMVRFKGGEPDRQNYRRFRVKTVYQSDDFAMMEEVVFRRYKRLADEKKEVPDLILIDGGKGQLSSAIKAVSRTGCPPIPVIGLAKKNEEVFIPGVQNPVIIVKDRPALKLLQHIRDEAHRFAISYHREIREKMLRSSVLDEIAGIGDEKKKLLLKVFGSISQIKKSTPDEISSKIPGIGIKTAEKILEFFNNRLT